MRTIFSFIGLSRRVGRFKNKSSRIKNEICGVTLGMPGGALDYPGTQMQHKLDLGSCMKMPSQKFAKKYCPKSPVYIKWAKLAVLAKIILLGDFFFKKCTRIFYMTTIKSFSHIWVSLGIPGNPWEAPGSPGHARYKCVNCNCQRASTGECGVTPLAGVVFRGVELNQPNH